MLNYIREYRRDYTAVFWIEAGSKESIQRDYIQIYRLLYGRPLGVGQQMVKVEDAVPVVKYWFHSHLDVVEVVNMELPEAIELSQRCAKIKEEDQDIITVRGR